jgi:hypothetical protein
LIIDVLGLLEVVLQGAETAGAILSVIEAIQDAISSLTPLDTPAYTDLSLEEKTALLKRCTVIVANLDLDLACFPLGYTTSMLFDHDGSPIP